MYRVQYSLPIGTYYIILYTQLLLLLKSQLAWEFYLKPLFLVHSKISSIAERYAFTRSFYGIYIMSIVYCLRRVYNIYIYIIHIICEYL